jgi:AraC-like DNA-binding protein
MKAEDLDRPSVAIAYVLLTLQLAAERGLERDSLLAGLDISARQLQQADSRVSFRQYGRLCARVLRLSGDPSVGYDFGLRGSMTVHGFLGLGVLSQPDVRGAVDFALRYAPRIRSPGFSLHFLIDGDSAALDLHETVQYGPLHQYSIDAQLVTVSTLLRTVMPVADMELWFRGAEPAHYAAWRKRLPACRFGMGANQVRFAAALLPRTMDTANAVTAALVRDYCERELSLLGGRDDWATRVRALLSAEVGRYPGIDELAGQMATSPRTLKRRLQEQGVSYTQLVNEARERDSVRLLRDTTLTIEQIAERMGYSEAANFSRAFHKLTGRAPSSLRA